jgi:DNA repair exonuclease SbcCD ATPase subunit
VEASQRVIELKKRRHALNQELSTFNSQLKETRVLLESLEYRQHAASDLARLKSSGVGRLDQIECPICHRDLDPTLFGLTSQSEESITSHIEALKSDRELVRKNLDSLSASVAASISEISDVDVQLRAAEQALENVNDAVGAVREQLAETASQLNAAERTFERLSEAIRDVEEFQRSIDRWVNDAKDLVKASEPFSYDSDRREAFVSALREYLVALGHSAINPDNVMMVNLDDQYVPFMGGRRLLSLGSSSDQPRLVAAYSLALASTSQSMSGKHPGFVILDEPLQQNPDKGHRDLFLTFLTDQIARRSGFQTVIFTWLGDDEINLLRQQGTAVITPPGRHFLRLE